MGHEEESVVYDEELFLRSDKDPKHTFTTPVVSENVAQPMSVDRDTFSDFPYDEVNERRQAKQPPTTEPVEDQEAA